MWNPGPSDEATTSTGAPRASDRFRPGEDDASRVELRALCLDAADPAWDGPVVAARAEGRADAARDYIREKTERAKEKAAELREKVKAHESVQKLQSKATEMRGKLSSQTANVRGKLSQWLDR